MDQHEQGIYTAREPSAVDQLTPQGDASPEATNEVSKATESDAAPAPIALGKGSGSCHNRGGASEFNLTLTDLPKLAIPPEPQAVLPD